MLLGSWNLDEIKGCNLPQKVATAFTAVTSELDGSVRLISVSGLAL